MIGFGLRLTLRGGREAATRLVLIAAAVMLGVAMLLATLAGINAVNSQNARYAWLDTDASTNHVATATTAGSASQVDPAWWLLTADEFRGTAIGRVDVAATGPNSPVPPGIPRLPGPGEYYASPALARLIHATPAAELGARYPGRQIGTVGAAALPAPDSLIIIVGHSPAELAHQHGATEVTRINTVTPSSCSNTCYGVGFDANGIDLVLAVVAAALLFPVLIFIATATRLSAARREQRFAAMRLVGATPRQIAIIAAVESTVAAAIGVGLGFALFFAVRPALAGIPFTGSRFYVDDLSLNLPDVLVVAIGIPLAAAVAARVALRRVNISPLGVSRRVTPRPPGAWRVLPLLLGLAELGYFVLAGRPKTTPGQIQAFLVGILLTMFGLVLAGPWLTMLGSRLMARTSRRAAGLIAARRLSDDPRAGFRAVSGLVLALFVASVAVSLIATIKSYDGGPNDTATDRATIADTLYQIGPNLAKKVAETPSTPPAPVQSGLAAIPGVQAVAVVHGAPAAVPPGASARYIVPVNGVVVCADIAKLPSLGRCRAGAATAYLQPELIGSQWAPRILPTAHLTVAHVRALPMMTLGIGTDGSAAAIEGARTVLEHAYPYTSAPLTVAENRAQGDEVQRVDAYQRLADVVILTSLPIAGCTLAVAVVAGLNDRRRPFSLLRLTGAPLGLLRRVVGLESAVPLLVLSVAAIGTGLLAAYLFARAQLQETLLPPDVQFYALVVAGLVAALAIIASTLPVLERITGAESARSE
jgi:hypothetical protein